MKFYWKYLNLYNIDLVGAKTGKKLKKYEEVILLTSNSILSILTYLGITLFILVGLVGSVNPLGF